MFFQLELAKLAPGSTTEALFLALGLVTSLVVLDVIKKVFRTSPYAHIPGPSFSSFLGTFFLSILSYFTLTPRQGYLPTLHSETSLFDFHYPITERYGHIARLKGGLFGVS